MTYLHPNGESTREDRESSLHAIFETRYAWLLRWALHFTENDRAAAEDLVQETFVRLLHTWDTLTDLDDLEPLLYSYLRYAHLSERRRGRSHAFQHLSSADFDTLAISLRSSSTFNQIEVQNEIREILSFLLWRRRTARFASMFLLRFFHAYFPEEIAAICITKRFGVDLGLQQARRELRAHLANPRQIQVLGRPAPHEQKALNMAIPADEFEEELRKNIFTSRRELCPPSEELERCYSTPQQRSLENDLLAHIVTCECCLDRVTRRCNVPPPSSRSMDDSLSRAPRGKLKKTVPSNKQRLARIFSEGESRMREVYEHHPTGLVIALNAEVVAVRDVNSARATLKVETRAVQALEIIEVFSEQGLLLLALPILKRPPKSQPELRREIALSGERSLSLVVRFMRDGALIETTYEDPLYTTDYAETEDSADERGINYAGAAPPDQPEFNGTLPTTRNAKKLSRWIRWVDDAQLRLGRLAWLVPMSAVVMVAVLLIVSVRENRQAQRIDANQLLRAAAHEEAIVSHGNRAAAIVQRVRIKDGAHSLERNLYRDVHTMRRPKESASDAEERILRAKLTEAKLDWNNPLSAESYRDWHDHLYREEERVAKTDGNLLTVTTNAEQGTIAQETLTVKADDFHTVARTVRFRDGESIEVAELSYEVVPWSARVESWFEPLPNASYDLPPPLPIPQSTMPARLNDAQLDIAELNVLLVLQELQADTERLDVTRLPNGVVVKGVVASEERKSELIARLQAVAHVKTAIASYRDLDSKDAPVQGTSRIQEMSVTAADTPLKSLCEEKKIAPDQCRLISYKLLNTSAALVRESKHISDLRNQFPSTEALSPTAQMLFSEVVQERLHHLTAALEQQEGVLQSLGIEGTKIGLSSPSPGALLDSVVQHNLTLSKELVYVGGEHSRPAPIILQELAESAGEVHTTISYIAANFESHSAFLSTHATPVQ